AGDRHRGQRRRGGVARIRVPVQARRPRAAARLRRPAPTAPGLADVVCGARSLRAEPLARPPVPPPARRLASRGGPVRHDPLRGPPSPLRPGARLRLPLHRPGDPPPDGRLVATTPGGRVLPGRLPGRARDTVTSGPEDELTGPSGTRLTDRMAGGEDEAQAVARARAGDQEAFRLLVEGHSRAVFRLAFRMTGNEHDAEDVVQETFLKAYRKLGAFEERAQFGSWLHRIAANCAYDLLRARARHDERLDRSEGPDGERTLSGPAGDPSPQRRAAARDL